MLHHCIMMTERGKTQRYLAADLRGCRRGVGGGGGGGGVGAGRGWRGVMGPGVGGDCAGQLHWPQRRRLRRSREAREVVEVGEVAFSGEDGEMG